MTSSVGLDLVRAAEAAAVAAARWAGRGDEQEIDQAAAGGMHEALSVAAIRGRIILGSDRRSVAPALQVGEVVGAGGGELDIALEALECTTSAARGGPGALSVIAASEPGGMLAVPVVYMNKVAVGQGLPEGVVDLDAEPGENVRWLASARGRVPGDITVCILDRPRHADLIGAVRETGASVRLIGDGDIVGVISAALPDSGIDMYLGVGGAPEGVLAAAALRSVGGWMEGRLVFRDRDQLAAATGAGIGDPQRKYGASDLASGDVLFAATGVTHGPLLEGARLGKGETVTQSVLMRSGTGSVRWIRTRRRVAEPQPTVE